MYDIRVYRCDYCGSGWEVRGRIGDGKPEGEDPKCPKGHPAVVCMHETPADVVSVLFRSSARIVDSVTGRLKGEGHVWLVLLDRNGGEIAWSEDAFPWAEAARLGSRFNGKGVERAMLLWKSSKL